MKRLAPFKIEYITKVQLKFSVSAIVGGSSYFIKTLIPYSACASASLFDVTSNDNPEAVIKSLPRISKRRCHVFLENQSIDNNPEENKITEHVHLLIVYDISGKICSEACCDKDSSFCIWAINSKVMNDQDFGSSGFRERTSSQCNCTDALALAEWMLKVDAKREQESQIASQTSKNSR